MPSRRLLREDGTNVTIVGCQSLADTFLKSWVHRIN